MKVGVSLVGMNPQITQITQSKNHERHKSGSVHFLNCVICEICGLLLICPQLFAIAFVISLHLEQAVAAEFFAHCCGQG